MEANALLSFVLIHVILPINGMVKLSNVSFVPKSFIGMERTLNEKEVLNIVPKNVIRVIPSHV
jgi:hypothetical protein